MLSSLRIKSDITLINLQRMKHSQWHLEKNIEENAAVRRTEMN